MRNGSLNQAKTIFVDYFDTLVFRKVTAAEVLERWALCLGKKYPSLPPELVEKLPQLRLVVFRKLREEALARKDDKTEVTYEEAIGILYNKEISQYVNCNKERFVSSAKEIDFAIECGSEYANSRLVYELQEQKKEGKKIYIVSDFYLGSGYLKQMMKAANVPDGLIDGIFVSCDCGKRKAVGDIYPFVLEKLALQASDVIMLGDNLISDCQNAKNNGLLTGYQPQKRHKVLIHLLARIGRDYSQKQLKDSLRTMFRYGPDYSEYIGMFYVFTERLYTQLSKENVQTIAFMAREGYYLKRLFELYEELAVPEEHRIRTSYYWCSRRSVMAGIKDSLMPDAVNGEISLRNWLKSLHLSISDVEEYGQVSPEEADDVYDLRKNRAYLELIGNQEFTEMVDDIIKENNQAFRAYTEKYIQDEDGSFRFVDSGWKCTTQNAIEQNYGIKTVGYYIGIQIPDQSIKKLERTGLIFSEFSPRSKYYDYLGMNIPFYQQLLAAPHGTALKYVLEGEEVHVLHEWDPMERKLYEEKIRDIQEYMLLKFRGLCAWGQTDAFDQKDDWSIAKQSMKSSLFANGSRLKFVRDCTENYVQNFRQEHRGKVKYDYKKAKMGIDIIWRPEKYLRYFAKIQRTGLYDHRVVRMLYPIFSHLYYMYVLLWHRIKEVV